MAFRSPPEASKAEATAATYCGLGLLVTSRWISCLPMKADIGCAARVSSATRRLACGSDVACTAMVVPKKLSSTAWYCG